MIIIFMLLLILLIAIMSWHSYSDLKMPTSYISQSLRISKFILWPHAELLQRSSGLLECSRNLHRYEDIYEAQKTAGQMAAENKLCIFIPPGAKGMRSDSSDDAQQAAEMGQSSHHPKFHAFHHMHQQLLPCPRVDYIQPAS